MIRNKQNFKPFHSVSKSGETVNEEITFEDIPTNDNKLTIAAQEAANPLNQPTPFEVDLIPEKIVVEGAET